jgi:hypothetical protein
MKKLIKIKLFISYLFLLTIAYPNTETGVLYEFTHLSSDKANSAVSKNIPRNYHAPDCKEFSFYIGILLPADSF